MRWMFLSKSMLESEAPMVYSSAYGSGLRNVNSFTVSSSQSQGFSWNQDLFASQYQQMCKVVYDGHEDTIDGLIASIKEKCGKIDSGKARQNSVFVGGGRRSTETSHWLAGGYSNNEEEGNNQDEDGDEALTDFEEDEEAMEGYLHENRPAFRSDCGLSLYPMMSEQFNRPRRISQRSISLVSDSKNGNYDRSECANIDMEEDTPENQHFKWLISA